MFSQILSKLGIDAPPKLNPANTDRLDPMNRWHTAEP